MRQMFTTRARALLIGLVIPLIALTLWAQEPRMENRGITVVRGNLVTATGIVFSGGGMSRDFRTNTSVTGVGAVYTTAQVLSGLIARAPGAAGNVTDGLPAAADLIAAMPGVATGSSFWLMIDAGLTPGGTITLSTAATGLTYSGGCATAISTSDAMPVLINITSATTYRAVCVNVNT